MAMPTGILGRDRELEVLRAAVADVGRGPRAVVLEGDAGVGKTSLWRWAVEAARDRGVTVLTSRPTEAEAAMSYAVLGDLLDEHLERVGDRLPPPQRTALDVALLRAAPEGTWPSPRAVAVAVLGMVRALAAAKPLIVAVDDVQWVDRDSAVALRFAARRLEREPVLGVLAQRSVSRSPMDAPHEQEARVTRIAVWPLDAEALRRLLEDRIGIALARPALLKVHAATGGNPLFALEVGRLLRDGAADAEPAAWIPIPKTLDGVLSRRLEALAPAARDVLLLSAALAQPTRSTVLAGAPDAGEGLDIALRSELLEGDGDQLRFAHPVIRSTVYANAPPDERQRTHRLLAALVDEPEERALHLALSADGPDAGIARTVHAAAKRAAARGAAQAALELAELARRLMPGSMASARVALTVDAADFAFSAGDTRRARRLLADVVGVASGSMKAAALVRLSTLATYDGTLSEARGFAARAITTDHDDARVRILAHRRLALTHLLQADLAAAERETVVALERARSAGEAALTAQALANLGCIRILRGRLRAGRETVMRACALERGHGPASIDDSPTAVAGVVQMYLGELDEARRRLESVLLRRHQEGAEALTTGVLFALGELEFRAGRFERARVHAEHGLAESEGTGQTTERSLLLFVRALSSAYVGDERTALPAASEGAAIAKRAEHRFAMAQNAWARGALEVTLGRPEEAWAALEPASRMLRDHGVWPGVVPVHADAVDAAVTLGRLRDAEAVVDELRGATPAPTIEALVARCAGMVLAASGEPERALDDLRRAVAAHRRLGRPFDLGRSLLALGQGLRRAKQRASARAALDEARSVFGNVGAAPWVERVDGEIRRLGGRPRTSGAGLTATEERIATLAAAGWPNKRIAAELFVTPRTVESNLTRAFRKLGVANRTELSRRLADRR